MCCMCMTYTSITCVNNTHLFYRSTTHKTPHRSSTTGHLLNRPKPMGWFRTSCIREWPDHHMELILGSMKFLLWRGPDFVYESEVSKTTICSTYWTSSGFCLICRDCFFFFSPFILNYCLHIRRNLFIFFIWKTLFLSPWIWTGRCLMRCFFVYWVMFRQTPVAYTSEFSELTVEYFTKLGPLCYGFCWVS